MRKVPYYSLNTGDASSFQIDVNGKWNASLFKVHGIWIEYKRYVVLHLQLFSYYKVK